MRKAAATTHERESASLDASLLLQHVTGFGRSRILAFPETTLKPEQQQVLDELLQRRCAGEPLAYITGEREFWSLSLALQSGTLVPRPDTELLVELALQHLPHLPAGPIIEAGTGSGAIALALAQEVSDRPIIAIERHEAALQSAHHNIRVHGHERVQLLRANWLDALDDASAALILSNPPYLAADDPHLPTLRFEPLTALVSGPTGLEDLRQLIIASQRVGLPGSLLLLEHGAEQGKAVRDMLTAHGFMNVRTCPDLTGLDRVSLGYHPASTTTSTDMGGSDGEC